MATLNIKDIRAQAKQAAETGPDLNIQQAQGDSKPPEKGATRLRFLEYVELGVHTRKSAQFGDKTKPFAQFGFELSGPKHPAREFEGKKFPTIIRFDEPIGTGAKNNYSKLFKLMVTDFAGRKNFGELLGEAYRGEVFHREYEVAGGKRIAVSLKSNDKGYSITSTLYEDQETGETKRVKVDAPLGDYRFFLWDYPTLEQWDSLYIGGTYDDGGSKNKVQDKIRAAENFVGSPIYDLLIEAGREAETVRPENKAADADPEEEQGEEEAPTEAPKTPQGAVKKKVEGKVASKKTIAPEPPGEADDNDPLEGL